MSAEPTQDPDRVRDRIASLLAGLPDETGLAQQPADIDLDAMAQRLKEAHDVLVQALESVEKG